jgi:1-acyl-sn-glycerol-3-phosphate acyltransferase
MKKKSILYVIVRPIVIFFTKCFLTPKFKGLENIPKTGRIVLAGTHTNELDCLLLICSTKREVHFLAKKELFKGPFGFIFRNLGLIAVDRQTHLLDAFGKAKEYLEMNEVIGIFPEGTTEKTGEILPFKKGACRMAYDTNSKIVPFVVKGKYTLWSRNLEIEFFKPRKIESKFIVEETKKLRDFIVSKKEG